MRLQLKTEDFVAKARRVHENRYDYTKSIYLGAKENIIITCQKHGDFVQRCDSHLRGSQCPDCAKHSISEKLSLDYNELKKRIEENSSKFFAIDFEAHVVELNCSQHGISQVKFSRHRFNYECAHCTVEKRKRKSNKTTKDFISDAKKIHGDTYEYGEVDYIRNSSRVIITCREHGNFKQTPNSHLSGRGCKQCFTIGYSRLAITWIEQEARSRKMKNIQHAENGGEYAVPNTNFRVDGYHSASRTIFEFHGDDFHGNPAKHHPFSRPHPYSNLMAFRLYMKTKSRERRLKALGYNLIVMWERDFKLKLRFRP